MSALKEAVLCVGGAKAAAKACGVSVRAIYKWLAADALPRTEYTGETDYVARLAKAAAAHGRAFNFDCLKAAAAPRKCSEVTGTSPLIERRTSERRQNERRASERRQAERRA